MIKYIIGYASCLALSVCLFGCNNQDHHKQLLETDGYSNVYIGSPAVWGCSDSDSVANSRNFKATKNGRQIEGQVCCGLILKGCTIRID